MSAAALQCRGGEAGRATGQAHSNPGRGLGTEKETDERIRAGYAQTFRAEQACEFMYSLVRSKLLLS